MRSLSTVIFVIRFLLIPSPESLILSFKMEKSLKTSVLPTRIRRTRDKLPRQRLGATIRPAIGWRFGFHIKMIAKPG